LQLSIPSESEIIFEFSPGGENRRASGWREETKIEQKAPPAASIKRTKVRLKKKKKKKIQLKQ
jgi:hypothetical protein